MKQPDLNLSKMTSCGRFLVTITAVPQASDVMLATEVAQSLKELSDLLADASRLVLELAVRVLEVPAESRPA